MSLWQRRQHAGRSPPFNPDALPPFPQPLSPAAAAATANAVVPQVTEAVAQLRNIFVTNRVSLYVDFYYSAADAAASQAIFNTLNANVRSGDFLAKVAKASTPLLTAAVYQEVFNQGVACTIA